MTGGPAHCEDDGYFRGDQAGNDLVERTLHRLSFVHQRQPDARAFGILRRQVFALEIDQYAASIRTPVLAEELEITPAAMINLAHRIACGMDGAPPAFAEMRAGDPGKLLELFGVDIE